MSEGERGSSIVLLMSPVLEPGARGGGHNVNWGGRLLYMHRCIMEGEVMSALAVVSSPVAGGQSC